MHARDLVIDNLASIATPTVVHRDAAIVVRDGRIVAVGPRDEVLRTVEPAADATVIDARGMSAIPGLVDCHTHAVWAGSRVDEFDRRAQGQSYEQIAAAGGGIKSTVAAVRAASEAELTAAATRRLARMRDARHDDGRGQVGLRPRPRQRGDDAARRARRRGRRRVRAHGHVPGAARSAAGGRLGRGVRPPRDRRDPARLRASRDGRRLLPGARRVLRRRVPAVPGRGPRAGAGAAHPRRPVLGVRRDPARRRARAPRRSTTSSRRDPRACGCWPTSGVAAVCLPLCALYLDLPMPPARALADAGARVVLATDFNPGSAPSESLLARDEPGLYAAAPVVRGGAARRHDRARRGAGAGGARSASWPRASPPTSS